MAFTGDNAIDSGSMSFGNVFFSSGDKTITGTMDVDGNFNNSFADSINGGLITVAGNFDSHTTISASTTAITLDGTSDQQIFVTAGLVSGHFTIDKASGNAILTNPVNFVSPGQDLTITSGVLDMNGFDLTIPDVLTLEASTHIVQAGGTLTYGTLVNNGGTGAVISSIPTPAATPTGVTWDGTNLWHADRGTGLIYELDTSGTVLSSFSAPGSSVRGLAWDGTNLWAIDDTSGTIYQLTTTGTVLSSFSAPGTGPRGLTWDGSNLWLSDTDTNTVYELTTTGTVLSNFSTPSTGPKGLAWDGTNLWLSDRVSNTVYELTTNGTVASSFSVPSSTRGLTWDGTNFWAVDAGLNVIYRLQGIDNIAPILGNSTLGAINEDEIPAMIFGETVSSIFSGQFSDPDSGSSFSGIAVVGNSANPVTEGAWQYSSNAGSDWFDIGTVSDDANALSIATSTRIRFVPVADFNGAPTALVVRGLDDTYGGGWSTTAGSETRVNVDTTGNGGTTAIAGATANLSTSITPKDDISFSINSSPARFEAGPTQIDFTLSLAGSISAGNTASVDIAPGGSATDGADYETFLTAVNTAALATTGVSLAGATLTFDDTFVGPNFAFSLNVIDDTLKEAPEQLITTLTNPTSLSGSAILGTDVAVTNINDNDAIVFTVSADNDPIGETGGSTTFTIDFGGVSLGLGTNAAVTVTPSGSALDGVDQDAIDDAITAALLPGVTYGAGSNAITFDGNLFTADNFQFTINALGDNLVEGDETFTLTLSSPINATLGGASAASVTITDDDAVVFGATATASVSEESAGTATFTINLGGVLLGAGQTASVDLTQGGNASPFGVDYTVYPQLNAAVIATPGVWLAGGVLTFDENFVGPTFSWTADVVDDNLVEGTENMSVILSNAVNATINAGQTIGSTDIPESDAVIFGVTSTANISEDTPGTATFTINLAGVLLDNGNTASVDVVLAGSSTSTDTLDHETFLTQLSAAATATTGVTLVGNTLTFDDTFVGPTFDFTIQAIDDNLVEGSETLRVGLINAVNANINGAQFRSTTNITETDAVVFGIASTASISEDTPGTTTFTVNLGGMLLANGNSASVDLIRTGTSTDGVDHQDFLTQLGAAATATTGVTLVGNTLTFDDTFVGPTFAFNITAIDDAFVEGTESLAISLSNAVGGAINGAQANASTDITETDTVVFGITSTPNISEEIAGTSTFTISLGGVLLGTGQTASVDVTRGGTSTSSDTLDHETFLTQLGAAATATTGVTLLGNTLTFDDTFVGPDFAFNIAAIDDNLVEGTETLRVGIGNAVNAFVNPAQSLVITSITETDAVVFQVTATANTYAEGNTITFTVDVGNVTLGAGLTASVDITPGGTTTDGVDHQDFMTQLAVAATATPGVTLVGNTLTFDSAFVGPNFTFDVLTFDDDLVEGTETLTATLSNALGGSLGALDTKSVNLNSNDNMTFNVTTGVSYAETDTVTFTIFTTTGLVTLEPGRTASVDITLSGTTTDGVDHQDFMTQLAAAVTATPGVTLVGNTLTFDSAWDGTNLEIHMDAVDDDVVENTETMTVTLSNAVGGSLGGSPTRTANLTSLDVMRYQLISQNSVNEGNTHNFRLITTGVTLGAGLTSSVDITPSGTATDGVDHQDFMTQVAAAAAATPGVTLVGNTLTFDSTWVGPEFTFDILTFDDNVVENTETVRGDLSNVVNGIILPPFLWPGNILSNDAVVFGIVALQGQVAEETPGTINYQINLGGMTLGAGLNASVDITPGGTATDGVDHQDFMTQVANAATATTGVTLVGNTLTFDSGFVGPSFNFNVVAIDDLRMEGTETVTAALSNAVGGTINAGQIATNTNLVEIDDILFGVVATPSTVSEDTSGTIIFTIYFNNSLPAFGQTASIDITPTGTTTDGVDHQVFMTQVANAAAATTGVTLAGNTLTFDDTFVGSTFAFGVTIINDEVFEGIETLGASLSNAVGGSINAGLASDSSNITEFDTIVLNISASNDPIFEVGSTTFTIDFGGKTIGNGKTMSVTVTPSGGATEGVDYEAFDAAITAALTTGVTYNSGLNTLTFDGNNYAASNFQFTVNALTDLLAEGNESFTATLFAAGNAILGGTPATTVTIIDNAAPAFIGLDATPTFVEDGPAILLDSNATVSDAEYDSLDDYTDAFLQLINTLGPNLDDIYTIRSGGNITVVSGPGPSGTISAGGNQIANFVTIGAVGIQIRFEDNGTTPTSALVDEVLQAIEYANASNTPPASVQIDYTFIDASGPSGLTGNGSITVSITPNNDAPVFSNLDANPTFVEDGPPIFLDTNATVSDPELSAADDYNGATLQIVRNGGGNADDSYTIQSGGSLTVGVNNISAGGNVIAIYVDLPATGMQVQFQDNGTTPTEALVNEVMQAIQYSNASNAPPANVQLDYTFFDGSGLAGNGFLIVDITPTNDPPVIINGPPAVVAEGATILGDLTNGVGDPDNAIDPASINIISGPTNGTLVVNPDGTASYTHNGSETISDVFTYTIDDVLGATSNVATVNFIITPVNDAPVITSNGGGPTAAINAAENQTSVTTVTYSDADVPTDTILYTLSGADALLFTIDVNGVLNFDTARWWVLYTLTAPDFETPHDANLDGIYEVTVQIDDGNGGIGTQDLFVTVTNVAEAPVIGGVDVGSVTEDLAVVGSSISASGLLTIVDPDAGESGFQPAVQNGAFGQLTVIASGAWSYVAANSQAAIQSLDVGETLVDAFTVSSIDGTNHNVTITINGTEDAPVANAIGGQTAIENTPFNFAIAANTFSDVDTSDTLTYTATLADSSPLPAWLTFNATTQTFSGTPGSTEIGSIDVRVIADDGSSTVAGTFRIAVITLPSPVVEPPVVNTTGNTDPVEEEETTPLQTSLADTGGGQNSGPPEQEYYEVPGSVVVEPPANPEEEPVSNPEQESITNEEEQVGDQPEPENAAVPAPLIENNSEPNADQQTAAQQQALQDQLSNQAKLGSFLDADDSLVDEHERKLWKQMDAMNRQMHADLSQDQAEVVEAKIVMGSTVSLTAGFISWVLRGGALLTSMVSSVSVLTGFDVLPILKRSRKRENVTVDDPKIESTDDTDLDPTDKTESTVKVDELFTTEKNK
ncbi:MAG: hypothetical protein DRI30_00505 [Chloroflexi bacterium]|nr:MAG: hypothetical protein DRI30_00505 [Chloroflexota bacterium]